MTQVLKTSELIDAAIARINAAVIAAEISYTPKIVQEGDLSFYPENKIPTDDIPAILLRASAVAIVIGEDTHDFISDLTGDFVGTETVLRIVLVDSWDTGQEVVDRKIQRTQEIAQAFIRGIGQPYNMGASISNYTIVTALPVAIELDPIEDGVVSQDEARQLYATAVTLRVRGRATRQ